MEIRQLQCSISWSELRPVPQALGPFRSNISLHSTPAIQSGETPSTPREHRLAECYSLKDLVYNVISEQVSPKHFLISYPRFATAVEVLTALNEQMVMGQSNEQDVYGLLELWIEDYPKDFSEHFFAEMSNFSQSLLNRFSSAVRLQKFTHLREDGITNTPQAVIVAEQKFPFELGRKVLQYPRRDIAEEIAIWSAELFLKVERRDWFDYSKKKAQPIIVWMQVLDNLSTWVQNCILNKSWLTSVMRLQMLLQVSSYLSDLGDFSALHVFNSGIQSALHRVPKLRWIICMLGAERKLNQWHELFRPNGYRNYIEVIKTRQPCIISIPIHLNLLQRADEGNEDSLDGLIHWGKFNIMGGLVETIVDFRSCVRESETLCPKRPTNTELRKLLEHTVGFLRKHL